MCRKAKYERYKPYGLLQPNKAPKGSWKVISIDFIRPLPPSPSLDNVIYEYIIVVIDRLIKYAIFILLPNGYNTKYLAGVFMRDVILKHGIPDSIILDRDSLFISHF